MRLFFAGIDKFREKGSTNYGFDFLSKNLEPISKLMQENTRLPAFMITPYFYTLAFALVLVGITCVLGLATRLSLFIGGLLFVSLSLGLMMLPDDTASVQLGVQVGLAALALVTLKPNPMSLDGLLFSKGCCPSKADSAE